MICHEFQLRGADGMPRFARAWMPVRETAGLVGIVHGLGEHSGRYHHVAEHLRLAGFGVVAFDQIGHGLSGGQRGHAPDFDCLLDDVGVLVRELENRSNERCPCFLYGHSLGGNLVLNFALRRRPDLAGLIVTSPLIHLAVQPPGWKHVLALAMNRVCPRAAFRTRIDPQRLSHDAQSVQRYRDDPLVHDRVSARLGLQMLAAGRWLLQHAEALTVPVLLLHGGGDRLTSAEASREFARRVGPICTLRIWPDLFHELHWETRRAEVFDTVLDWTNHRIANA